MRRSDGERDIRRRAVSGAVTIALLLAFPSGPTGGLVSVEAFADGGPTATHGGHSPVLEPRFVREAQRTLGDLGYQVGPVDGVVGPSTRGALLRYQEAVGLPVTGRLDSESVVRLDIHGRLFRAGPRP